MTRVRNLSVGTGTLPFPGAGVTKVHRRSGRRFRGSNGGAPPLTDSGSTNTVGSPISVAPSNLLHKKRDFRIRFVRLRPATVRVMANLGTTHVDITRTDHAAGTVGTATAVQPHPRVVYLGGRARAGGAVSRRSAWSTAGSTLHLRRQRIDNVAQAWPTPEPGQLRPQRRPAQSAQAQIERMPSRRTWMIFGGSRCAGKPRSQIIPAATASQRPTSAATTRSRTLAISTSSTTPQDAQRRSCSALCGVSLQAIGPHDLRTGRAGLPFLTTPRWPVGSASPASYWTRARRSRHVSGSVLLPGRCATGGRQSAPPRQRRTLTTATESQHMEIIASGRIRHWSLTAAQVHPRVRQPRPWTPRSHQRQHPAGIDQPRSP